MTECILHNQSRYGTTHRTVGGVRHQVGKHVAALIDKTGELPNGRHALHSCDTPNCINPDHLSWGTAAQNIAEAVARGRHVPHRGLTDAQVRAVRSSTGSVAGVPRGVAYLIRHGKTYKDVV